MATQLSCPRCKEGLPASFSARAGGVCPCCQAAIVAKRPKTAKRSTTILRSQPYRAPADLVPPATVARLPRKVLGIAAGAIGVLLVACAVWFSRSTNRPVVGVVENGAPPLSTNDSSELTSNAAIANTVELLAPLRPGKPKVRVIQRDDAPALGVPLASAVAPLAMSSAVDPDRVERAIRQGKQYLIANKHRWLKDAPFEVGYAALPALALLEVGVPANDAIIGEAAAVVRRRGPMLRDTYEISLAILFLDRFGDPADGALIRSLALRLVAGQTSQWGWDYKCPLLPAELETPLQTMLERLRPEGQWETPLPREPGQGLVDLAIPLTAGKSDLKKRLDGVAKKKTMPSNLAMPLVLGDGSTTRDLVKEFPAALRSLPIVDPMNKSRGGARDDNSNTQFALLALWTARRHGVLVDRSLLLGDRRFATSQNPDGSWGYHFRERSSRPSMTCVGLLGLALGHGALLPDVQEPKQTPRAAADPAIQRGLEALGRAIGDPNMRDGGPTPNLYFLWSLERVAMMYQLPTIGGKDWFGWGANDILASQRPDGGWSGSTYHGSTPPIDTAFALLFLHRSNLVPDLTQRLQLHMAITDPERR